MHLIEVQHAWAVRGRRQSQGDSRFQIFQKFDLFHRECLTAVNYNLKAFSVTRLFSRLCGVTVASIAIKYMGKALCA